MIELIVGLNILLTIGGVAYVFNYASSIFNAQADLIDKLIKEIRKEKVPDPDAKDFLYGVKYELEEE